MEDILDRFDEFPNQEKTFKLASTGQRFANYLLDFIGYIILALIIVVILGFIQVMMGNESYLIEEEDTFAAKIADWIVSILIMTVYYTTMEYFFKGKTLGKLITGTRAVTIDNERMDLQTTFVRTMVSIRAMAYCLKPLAVLFLRYNLQYVKI